MIKKALIVTLFTVASYATEVYSLDELITKALVNSPDINISKLDVAAAQQKIRGAKGGYLPTVDFSQKAHHDKDNTLLTGSLSASELLYDFGKTGGDVDKYKNQEKSLREALLESIINKKRDVKTSYFTILQDLALIKVNQENLKLDEAQFYRAKKYYEAGIRTKVDISNAKVNLIKAKIALKNANYALKQDYVGLDRIIGFSRNREDYRIKTNDINLTNALYSDLPKYTLSLEDAITYAYKHRPELLKYNYNVAAKKSELRSIKAAYYPKLSANANYNRREASRIPQSDDKNQWSTEIALNWNLYNGGSDKAAVEEQKILLAQESATLRQTELSIKEDVTKAYINLQKAYDDVELSQNLLSLSKEKFYQVSRQYVHGLADYIELQEARKGYIDAKSDLVISYYNYYSTMAILDATIGK